MSEYKLYGIGESGNVYKVALMLTLCGLDWEPRPVDFFNGETRQDKFRSEVNEMGEVPVLEHGGRRRSQSGAILAWLADRTGQFAPADEEERLEIFRWILFDNQKFTGSIGPLRFQFGIQKTGETPVTEFLRGRANAAFAVVDKHLAGRDFVLGSRPTIADLSMVGYLYYPEATGIDRAAFPNVQRWTERIASLPRWAHPYDLMPRALPVPA